MQLDAALRRSGVLLKAVQRCAVEAERWDLQSAAYNSAAEYSLGGARSRELRSVTLRCVLRLCVQRLGLTSSATLPCTAVVDATSTPFAKLHTP